MGFAFKANTNYKRGYAAIKICKDLLDEGAILHIHDPKVDPQQISIDLGVIPNHPIKNKNNSDMDGSWSKVKSLENVFKGADAAVVLTEWEEYSNINWNLISKRMRHPAWVFDSRSIVKKEEVLDANLKLWKVGDGTN